MACWSCIYPTGTWNSDSVVAAVGAAEGLVTYLKQDDRPEVNPPNYKMNAIVAALARRPEDLGDLTCEEGLVADEAGSSGAGVDRRLFRHPGRDHPQEVSRTEATAAFSASARSNASASITETRRTSDRPMSPKRCSRWSSVPRREAAAKWTSPIGLLGVAPVGPAMPVIDTARSAAEWARAPVAMASEVCRLTAPN